MVRRLAVAVVGSVMLLATAARVMDWPDERRLWQAAVAVAPEKPRPWINLGSQYQQRGDAGLAAYAYREAFRVAQTRRSRTERVIGMGLAEANLALLAAERGNLTEAVRLTETVLARSPHLSGVRELHTWLLAVQAGSLSSSF